jgi:DNA-binding MarR family transcriptional regulator
MRRTEAAAGAVGLSEQRYNLLLIVKAAQLDDHAATITMLTGRLQLPQPAVSELVRRAEAVGLVWRRRARDDGRVRVVELTPGGETRLMRAFTSLHDDRQELASALADLVQSFELLAEGEGT